MDKALDERGSTTPYQSTPAPRLPAYLPPPRVSERNQVTWGNPDWSGSSASSSQDDIIYVLLMHGDGGWREVTQVRCHYICVDFRMWYEYVWQQIMILKAPGQLLLLILNAIRVFSYLYVFSIPNCLPHLCKVVLGYTAVYLWTVG